MIKDPLCAALERSGIIELSSSGQSVKKNFFLIISSPDIFFRPKCSKFHGPPVHSLPCSFSLASFLPPHKYSGFICKALEYELVFLSYNVPERLSEPLPGLESDGGPCGLCTHPSQRTRGCSNSCRFQAVLSRLLTPPAFLAQSNKTSERDSPQKRSCELFFPGEERKRKKSALTSQEDTMWKGSQVDTNPARNKRPRRANAARKNSPRGRSLPPDRLLPGQWGRGARGPR